MSAAMVPSQQQQPWWQPALQAAGSAVQGIQQQLQRLQPPHTKQQHQQQRQEQVALPPQRGSTAGVMGLHTAAAAPSTALTSAPSPAAAAVQRPHSSSGRQVTKEELGRATWTFLHTLAAQFPEHPSRQQQKDARTLMDLLGRIYPCADCASHFQEIVRSEPPVVTSGPEFQAWMCRAHNAVNRRLGKPTFNCSVAAARWAPLDCGPDSSCDLSLGSGPGRGGRKQ